MRVRPRDRVQRHRKPLSSHGAAAFSLLEMMVVITLILLLTAVTSLSFANARQSVKLRKDVNQCLAFLRNMWDYSKASGTPLILIPDYGESTIKYIDPRSQVTQTGRFSSKAHVLAVVLNDRAYNQATTDFVTDEDEADEGTPDESNAIFISEGRGLTSVAVVLGLPTEDESYELVTMARLNLITGKGEITELGEEQWLGLMEPQEEEQDAVP
jgi:type II secretory pathway pseudopilin PulG